MTWLPRARLLRRGTLGAYPFGPGVSTEDDAGSVDVTAPDGSYCTSFCSRIRRCRGRRSSWGMAARWRRVGVPVPEASCASSSVVTADVAASVRCVTRPVGARIGPSRHRDPWRPRHSVAPATVAHQVGSPRPVPSGSRSAAALDRERGSSAVALERCGGRWPAPHLGYAGDTSCTPPALSTMI